MDPSTTDTNTTDTNYKEAALNIINSVNPQHRAALLSRFNIPDDTVPESTDDGGMEQVERDATEAFQSYCQLYPSL